MPKDFRKEVIRDEGSRKAWLEWLQQRVETIHQRVTAHDVLRHGGIPIQGDSVEQFSCPFHGVDVKPSARVYPEDARSRSHAWCFVCQQRWDAIALWKLFNPGDDNRSFSRVVKEIEQAFGITTPEMPSEASLAQDRTDTCLESFEALYEVVERRLTGARVAYRYLDDMKGFLSAAQVLDKLRYRVDNKLTPPERGEEILRQLLDRIGKKVRACPEG